jgi:hypothetical protein
MHTRNILLLKLCSIQRTKKFTRRLVDCCKVYGRLQRASCNALGQKVCCKAAARERHAQRRMPTYFQVFAVLKSAFQIVEGPGAGLLSVLHRPSQGAVQTEQFSFRVSSQVLECWLTLSETVVNKKS